MSNENAQELNILIVGVGGMGVITLGNVLKEYGMLSNKISYLRASESRGVAQREGTVYAFVRYIFKQKANNPQSSIVLPPQPLKQKCNLILALEPLEFIRNINLIDPEADVILNLQENIPKNSLKEDSIQYPNIELKIQEIKKLYPKIKITTKNYTKLAIEKFSKSIMANKLILEELPVINSNIFDTKQYKQLIEKLF